MWLLVIATTFFAHSGSDPTIYQFQEFSTEKRCLDFKSWVEQRSKNSIADGKTTVTCVRK